MRKPDLRGPRIVLSGDDANRLKSIAFSALLRARRLAGALLAEVDRAAIVLDARLASRHAGLGSQVRFRDAGTDAVHDIRLIDPRPTDRLYGDLTVLSPLGIALIGMGLGQTGPVPARLGGDRWLCVLQVGRRI